MSKDELLEAIHLSDALIHDASKNDLSEALKILALILEKYHQKCGEIPMGWLHKIKKQERLDDLDKKTLNLILQALKRLNRVLQEDVKRTQRVLH